MSADIHDLELIRAQRTEGNDIDPKTLLRVVLKDCEEYGDVVKVFVTIIRDQDDCWKAVDYRCNMTRAEEIAFGFMRQLELVERWRGKPEDAS